MNCASVRERELDEQSCNWGKNGFIHKQYWTKSLENSNWRKINAKCVLNEGKSLMYVIFSIFFKVHMKIPSDQAEGISCLLTCTYSHNINHIVYSVFFINSTGLNLKPIQYMILFYQSLRGQLKSHHTQLHMSGNKPHVLPHECSKCSVP